ncbi:hypothetical protein [Methanonatronarchaeum sp. AMET-Sl]|uniref:hypothetical protein n=1 Tax=Methanonatronarchaeum sp. AMET-Sl TaxID=3037654 RepID=UPI00244E0194|nr:hypothetical protein [Methanonatronarchaeum sp. AMET-Sl]WGI18119.1 hypothetical protein QEN48_03705 [Methanonatronarchaeum sp. AMET-Sl]
MTKCNCQTETKHKKQSKNRHHKQKKHNHSSNCTCHCNCHTTNHKHQCNCEEHMPQHNWRRFVSKEEKIQQLHEYKQELEYELMAVEEKIEQLK